jgi:hypothetical protein
LIRRPESPECTLTSHFCAIQPRLMHKLQTIGVVSLDVV